MSAIQKRRKELRTELSLIEKQIYDLETTYLEDSRDFGNIFVGWKTYIAQEKDKGNRKKAVQNEERLFSLSSVTSPASRKEERDNEKAEGKVKKDEKKPKLPSKSEKEGKSEEAEVGKKRKKIGSSKPAQSATAEDAESGLDVEF